MGKKTKKTRWRTLTLNGHQSDSEDSSTKSSLQTSKGYPHKYSKFPYSSQSTPVRKFQHESSKSTRSNSTTSEHKTTFNEDEYTRITTPRQDVLFKKGYLNKPKTYQTQTSTGTSSTANSTSTCTPDHQSADGAEETDLEYESQFVFPNGFIDHNGIYYINSFEPFPLVVYNAPICYPEYSNSRGKRYSTDSMAESISPHNEEVNQESSQNTMGELVVNNTTVFTHNYMHPSGYYYNNSVSNHTNGQYIFEETRRIKKKRRRKTSRTTSSNNEDLTSEGSDHSGDEVFSASEQKDGLTSNPIPSLNNKTDEEPVKSEESVPHNSSDFSESNCKQNGCDDDLSINNEDHITMDNSTESKIVDESITKEETIVVIEKEQNHIELTNEPSDDQSKSNSNDAQNLLLQSLLKSSEKNVGSDHLEANKPNSIADPPKDCNDELPESSLKPDAEEFIPRMFIQHEPLPFDPNVQFVNVPPNFIPIPFLNHVNELQRPPPFLPPGMPLNFIIPQNSKIVPNFANLVPDSNFVPKTNLDECTTENTDAKPCQSDEKINEIENNESCSSQNELQAVQVKKPPKTEIDIAKIVYKLEEAAKQQRHNEIKRPDYIKRNGYKYGPPKSYQNQKGRFPNHSYHNRTRSNNLEQTYEKRIRRHELRSKPKISSDDKDKLEEKPEVQSTDKSQKPLGESTEKSIPANEHENSVEENHEPVNNVNIRLNDNCSIINKDLKLENNYSETLKKKVDNVQKYNKTNKCPRYEKHKLEKTEKRLEEKPIVMQPPTPKPQKIQNQWISVSNRKKRKNKGNEEQNSLDEQEEASNDDHLFESFDVDLLVDVVPPLKTDENIQPIINAAPETKVEYNSTIVEVQKEESTVTLEIAKEESQPPTEKPLTKSKNKAEDKKRKSKKKSQIKRVIITDVSMECEKPASADESKDDVELVRDGQPPECKELNVTKNDIIEDVNPVLVEVLDDKINDLTTIEAAIDKPLEESVCVVDSLGGTPEKKSKKKKKKSSPKNTAEVTKLQSTSELNSVLIDVDESFDFILDNSVLEDIDQKTNIEISQELDKIIQKGLYSNLEEKIRALKISDLDDGFFKTINVSHHVPEKSSNFMNTSSFGKVFKNTSNLFKTPKSKDELNQENLINIDFSKIELPDLEPQPSTSKASIFLENPEVAKIMDTLNQDDCKTLSNQSTLEDKTKKVQDERAKDKQEQLFIEKGEKQNATIEQDTKNLTTTSNIFSSQPKQEMLYPITQAVKEWMNKTRENTPDVEILKSPNTIYKEFCEIETKTETESTEETNSEHKNPSHGKAFNKEPSPLSNGIKENQLPTKIKRTSFNTDDEITVWSLSPQNSIEEDLIDCWDHEADLEPNHLQQNVIIPNGEIKEIKGSVQNSHTSYNGHIEKGEEAVEVYESKYGKNEDFLKIKAEIEEQRKNINFPRHGDLPYRAICCSIM